MITPWFDLKLDKSHSRRSDADLFEQKFPLSRSALSWSYIRTCSITVKIIMYKLTSKQTGISTFFDDVGWTLTTAASLWKSRSKNSNLGYRSCKYGQLAYLPLAPYTPSRNLRSSNSDRLNEPLARLATGERRFSHHAPRVWNSLPITVRSASTLDTFKARLKTHLFDIV